MREIRLLNASDGARSVQGVFKDGATPMTEKRSACVPVYSII